ncbi:MAG TPA: acyl-CoA dehydrogenase family protein [Mycobacteriales bacterium]|nr:acyl-CoA dehydrogenase family protein [Mycobacteriales bacterium]
MNGRLDETQRDLRDLATELFRRTVTPERLDRVAAEPERFDRALWAELAGAGLLGVAVPEEHGGLGLGLIELSLVCEQLGRAVAAVPLVATSAAAAALAAHGSDPQRKQWLPAIAEGTAVVALTPPQSAIGVRRDGDALSGQLIGVPWAHVADALLVPVGADVLLLDPTSSGVTTEDVTTTGGELAQNLTLDGATAEPVGSGAWPWLRLRWLTLLAATQAGVTDAALRLTAAYTSGREQFGKPLSTFQGVALKAADGYLDTTAIHAVARQAAWALDVEDGRIEAGDSRADATLAALTAGWWAAEAGQHCVHLTQHLHGGMGADVTYPAHRYFLWGKQIELLTGGASALLAELGEALASRPRAGDALALD